MKRFIQGILERSRYFAAYASGKRIRLALATVILPVSLGLFPLLFIYAQNTGEMAARDILVPALLVCLSAVIGTGIMGFILKSLSKGSLLTAILLFSFFTYGRVLQVLPAVLGTGHFLLPLWGAVIAACFIGIGRSKRGVDRLCRVLMQVGVGLVILQVARAGYFLTIRGKARLSEAAPASAMTADAALPDIYYIVVDGYGRSDILKEMYGVDNSPFIGFLKDNGFHVPEGSNTHYCQTAFEICAVLNMDYIDALGEFDRAMTDREPVVEKLKNNRVIKLLKDAGYSTVAFFSGYSYTELENSDVFLKPKGAMSEFENVLLSTTVLPAAQPGEDPAFARHRRMVTYALDKLPRVTEAGSPKFVFAHIISPHPPFVFDEQGNPLAQREAYNMLDGDHFRNGRGGSLAQYIEGYSGQVKYLTTLLQIMIEKLLQNHGENKPIIILQSDHGPASELTWESFEKTNIRERMGNLNAYYLPGHETEPQYADIDPINIFRTIFNVYFGARLQLLPGKNYFITWSHPYDFIDVTDRLTGEQGN